MHVVCASDLCFGAGQPGLDDLCYLLCVHGNSLPCIIRG
jgi:hypothetical protein